MEFADSALARRLEGAMARVVALCAGAHARLFPAGGATSIEVAGGVAGYAGPGAPTSQAVGLGLDGPVGEAEVDRLEAFYRDRGCSTQVELCTLADPSLLESLARRGYRATEFTHVLCRRLAPGEGFAPPPPSVEIRRAGPDEDQAWVGLLARCFGGEAGMPPEASEGMAALFHGPPGMEALFARLDGDPAGAAGVAIHGGVAALFGAGTLPGCRGRGVQSALIADRLARGARAGCDLAVGHSRPGTASQRNMERHGLRVVFARAMMVKE